jgi:hypothetical protein
MRFDPPLQRGALLSAPSAVHVLLQVLFSTGVTYV